MFPTRPDTNWAVQPQKMDSVEALDLERRGIYYQCSGNHGAEYLHSYFADDLHLCFPYTVKALINARAFIRIITYHRERGGRLFEATVN